MAEKLDAKYIKEKIKKYLEEHGPELPVHVAKHISMNSIFTSAFLSEMAGEGIIKISDMKVGGSPLYYTPEKYAMLEKYFGSLGSKEREACLLLKEKGILRDDEQTPVIRVALRSVKDFAFPFKQDEKLFWRYFLLSEDEVRARLEKPKQEEAEKVKEKEQQKKKEDESKEKEAMEKMKTELEEERKRISQMKQEFEEEKKQDLREREVIKGKLKPEETEGVLGKEEAKQEQIEKVEKEEEKPEIKLEPILEVKKTREDRPKKAPVKKAAHKKAPKKEKPIDESFLNEIKALLEKKQAELLRTESFDKKHVFAKIKIGGEESLLAAFNKKRIGNQELLKISKLAGILNLPYVLMLKGELPKKTRELIEAYKRLSTIEKLEQAQS